MTPKTSKAFRINIWVDGPWDNNVWKGRKIGQISVPAGSARTLTEFSADVSSVVDRLDKKHAIFLVAESEGKEALFDFEGLGFSSDKNKITRPVVPSVQISVDGKSIDLPRFPVRSTNENGILGYDQYEVTVKKSLNDNKEPTVSATASSPDVKIAINQPRATERVGIVKFDYRGVVKTYKIIFTDISGQ